MAAYSTIDGRIVHSLHAYFLRRGDFNLPIVYQVDRSRDGQSFSSRRVVAIQNGEPIFTFSSSFQEPEDGLDHQVDMPNVPPPEALHETGRPKPELLEKLPDKIRSFLLRERPFELRYVEEQDYLAARPRPPLQRVWIRAKDRLPDDDRLHRCLLAYASDFNLLNTACYPHGVRYLDGNLIMASIDHAMWFHRPFRLDDWLLYAMESPSTSGARGYVRGTLYTREGRLVASVAQEGLMRVVRAPDTATAVQAGLGGRS
jgi:acyl-CoA thioesterase II